MKSVFKFVFAFCFALAGTLMVFAAPENHEEFARQYMPELQAINERFRKDCDEMKLLRDSLVGDLKVMNRDPNDDAAYCALVYKIDVLENAEDAWAKFLKDCYFKYKGGMLTNELLAKKDLDQAKKWLVWEEKILKPFLKNIVDFSKNPPKNFVAISPLCLICKYEVTQKEYQEVMGKNPSHFKGNENCPVESVSWHDAMAFCKKLTERERAAGRLSAGYKYTLPTSRQWEIACRAGTTTAYCSGDTLKDLSRVAWWLRNSNSGTHPVGTREPNAWGIYDMHGNVDEWCFNEFGYNRVVRGGSYRSEYFVCVSSYVYDDLVSSRRRDLGFRVVLVP